MSRLITPGLLTVLLAATGCADSSDGGRVPRSDEAPIGDLALIPAPQSVTGELGHLYLDEHSRIVAVGEVTVEAELLAAVLRRSTGYPFTVRQGNPSPGDVVLELDPALEATGAEGYRLVVSQTNVAISAPTATGVFHGCQTLRQLLPPAIESPTVVDGVEWAVPMVTIEDTPRYAWRGFMLDVARHFFTADEVRGLIDAAAHYKLGVLHLHLTDDQGWRLEITSWPDLTRIGGTFELGGGEGGFYTQAEYTAIVEHAAARHVTVVPEIDMPGHCTAALASYGELNEDGVPAEPYLKAGVSDASLWLGAEITDRFVREVLGEVAALTPGPFLHIGGDEAHGSEPADYDRFIADVQAVVAGLGKTFIGWDEVGSSPLEPGVLVQYWFGEEDTLAAIAQGARIISSPAKHAYLDMIHDMAHIDMGIGQFWAGATDCEDAYTWDPVPAGADPAAVIGVEGALWTETVEIIDDVEFLVFPRLLGYAELGWSPAAGRSWDEYRQRLAHHGERMAHWGLDYYDSPLVPWTSP